MLGALDRVRDESGKDAPVRLVFEPKSRNQDVAEFANLLLSHTSLESSSSINMVMIGLDGRPGQKNLADVLHEWGRFRLATVRRRTAHRLGQVNDRIHILEGRHIIRSTHHRSLSIDKTSLEAAGVTSTQRSRLGEIPDHRDGLLPEYML